MVEVMEDLKDKYLEEEDKEVNNISLKTSLVAVVGSEEEAAIKIKKSAITS
jgi:hypothetical protein